MTEKTLCTIYISLNRSIIDYSLRSIQYHALRHAMRNPIKSSHKELLEISKICTIDKRFQELNEKYFINAFRFENELVIETCKNYSNWYPNSRAPKYKTILCYLRDTIKTYLD